jgi:glucosylceramidase
VLKLARELNPDLLFYASPWSPPAWMKTNQSLIGGSLDRKWYGAYARYFVKFVQAYQGEGIPIHAVTIQNEPGVDRSKQPVRWHYPSCRYTGEQERDFIRDHLGPAFSAAGLKTKIWSYDHNFNEKAGGDDPGIDYPTVVMTDAQAGKYVAGVAFHGYEGNPAGMSTFHARFPNVPVHFSEGSVFGIRGVAELIAILRNWASSYNAWVTIIDENRGPNNGPFKPSRTMITLDSKAGEVKYHSDFYFYTQFMRFVKRGAVRLGSSGAPENVAFQNPDGQIVLIMANTEQKEARVRVESDGSAFETVLPRQSVGTYAWSR